MWEDPLKTLLKWLGIAVTALVCLGMLGAAWVFAASNKQLNRRYTVPVSWITPADPTAVERGRHLGSSIAGCVDCHGPNLGGTMMMDDPAFGRIAASNLTRGRGGVGTRYSDLDYARAIQHGVKANGRAAIIMPAEAYTNMSDDDLAAVIAWVRAMPPVDTTWPAPALGPVARMLIATGAAPLFAADYIDHERRDVLPRPAIDTTPEYGRYLARIGGCPVCHNPALSGGKVEGGPPNSPMAANLTPTGLSSHTEADFVRVLREGKGLGGREINAQAMPWRTLGKMTDSEIHAVWLYLRSLPPKELGER